MAIKGRVSLIVATFNCEKTIRNLLESVLSLDWEDLELIIVDNGSKDNTLLIIEEEMPELEKRCVTKLIKLPRNVGFCRAANVAVQNSLGEFLCFIDHDIEMMPQVLKELIARLESNNSIGAVQPKVISAYDRISIDSHDINEHGSIKGTNACLYKKSRRILYPIGACFATRRKTYDQIGGFYDDFFVGNADVDFGWRIWLFGYSVESVPSCEIYHTRGTLSKMERTRILGYNDFKNKTVMIIQNFEKKNVILFLPRLFREFLACLILNRSFQFYMRLKALVWVARHFKLFIKRRRFIQHSRKIRDEKLTGMLEYIFPVRAKIAKRMHLSSIDLNAFNTSIKNTF